MIFSPSFNRRLISGSSGSIQAKSRRFVQLPIRSQTTGGALTSATQRSTKILILRQHCPVARGGEVPDATVIGISQSHLTHGRGRKSTLAKPAGENGRQLRVHEESHGSGGHENGVIKIARGIRDAGANVAGLEIRKVSQDFLLSRATGEHVEHVLDANTHPPDAGAPATLVGIDGDSVELVHGVAQSKPSNACLEFYA